MKYTRSNENENENEIARAKQDRMSVIEDADVITTGENIEPVVDESEQIVLEDGVNTEKEKKVEVEKEVDEEVEVINVRNDKDKNKNKEKEKESENGNEVEKEIKRREISILHPIVVQDRDDDVAIIVSPKAPPRSATHTKGKSRSKKPQTPKSPPVIFRTSPRPVEQLDMFTKEVVRRYESHGHACRLMNIQRMVMTQCCANQMLSAGNFSWRESLIVSSKGKL